MCWHISCPSCVLAYFLSHQPKHVVEGDRLAAFQSRLELFMNLLSFPVNCETTVSYRSLSVTVINYEGNVCAGQLNRIYNFIVQSGAYSFESNARNSSPTSERRSIQWGIYFFNGKHTKIAITWLLYASQGGVVARKRELFRSFLGTIVF